MNSNSRNNELDILPTVPDEHSPGEVIAIQKHTSKVAHSKKKKSLI